MSITRRNAAALAILTVLLCASAPPARACDYCSAGAFCCGAQGEVACLIIGCDACAPGLHFDSSTSHCEAPCSNCESSVGTCCGDVGQAVCDVSSGCSSCKSGLRFNVGSASCENFECSYCQSSVGDNCCGDNGQVSCAGSGQMASGSCNYSCKTGNCFDPGTAHCETCDSCDDAHVFTVAPCGKSYQRRCEVPCPECDADYDFDIDQNRFDGTDQCQPTWRAPSGDVPQTGFDFTFFVVGDTHVGDTARGLCSPTSAYKVMTTMVNTVGSSGLLWPDFDDGAGGFLFSKHGQPIGDPRAIVLTGDMTHRGGDSELTSFSPERRAFQDYWDERRASSSNSPSVKFTVYPGFGNHDRITCGTHERNFFETFVDFFSTQSWWDDNVNCPIRRDTKNDIMDDYMVGRMKDRPGVNFDENTNNYSWDWGPFHLVQGNTWAGDNDNLTWLTSDLAAHAVGKPVILFQHYGWESFSQNDEWWTDAERVAFHDLLAQYTVLAIFTGHSHTPFYYPSTSSSGPGFEAYTTDDGGDDDICSYRNKKDTDFDCTSDAECDDLYDGTTDTCDAGECDYEDANNGVIKGDGGITVVRIADLGGCQARFEVAQLQWEGDYTSASQMTAMPKGIVTLTEGDVRSPTTSRVFDYCARCGNGMVEGSEQCDDGNTASGDCCDANCQRDASGTSCTTDGNVCTDDVCNGAGTCTHDANAASCDDGIFCNGLDTCSAKACTVHAGDPCVGRLVCANTCNETAQDCLTPAGTACTDDVNACTTDECDGGGACDHTPIVCDDSDACTDDTCDRATGCVFTLHRDATFFSLKCRLAALIADVTTASDLSDLARRRLLHLIQDASQKVERAEQDAPTKRRRAKSRLRSAIRRLISLQYRVTSLTGRHEIDAVPSARILLQSRPLQEDMQTLLEGL